MEEQIAPTEVDKIPDVIRKAKYEVGRTDVLICGRCHLPFYYIEEFLQHRSQDKCTEESILRENEKVEPKEMVWAFTLWKNGILNAGKRTEPLTTWTLYKRWCELDEFDKEAWIIAGQNLQTFTRLSSAKLHEIKGKTQAVAKKTKLNSTPEKINTLSTLTQNNDLEEGEVRLSQLTEAQKVAIKAQIAANQTNKENAATEIKKVPVKLAQLYTELTKKPPELRKALRTGKNNTVDEHVFQKVLSRRFNHKNKCLEYFVKWENMKESENTWEPKAHFEKCKQIMDEFDKVFNTSKIIPKAGDSFTESESEQTPLLRPPRSSKQKAKDQVKSWCDSMSDDEEASSKRKLFDDDSDSTDSFEKKMKMEEESDSSDEDRPTKKAKSTPFSINGIGKKSAENIMPQRIVRVSQKHLPNLSTGVYIMSKTEGIIKLNSDTPLSSSSPLLKVGQRIGQTNVRMVKKDAPKTPVKILPKLPKVEVAIPLPAVKVVPSPCNAELSNPPEKADEDSDGLSDMDFPTDLPLPEPDSPPGDFVLDPLTGKIAGQEYVESKEELDVVTESEPEPEQEVTSLDSLVKMAVSDLPDVDDITHDDKVSIVTKVDSITSDTLIDPDTPPTIILDSPPVSVKSESPVISKTDIQPIASTSKSIIATEIDLESAITVTAIEKSQPVPPLKPKRKPELTTTSILNAALTSAKIQPKKLLSTTPNTVRQKVVPRPQMRMPTPSQTIIHKIPNRPKPFPQRTQMPEPIIRRSPNVNTYKPASSVTRRIGSTTIYKTSAKPQPPQTIIKSQPLYKQSIVSRVPSVSKPTMPISMPLIGIDDEPESIPSTSSAIAASSDTDLLQNLSGDLPTINLADTDAPLFITGEDGTIYQVAGQNEEGQTILISEGPDGQQQCVIVTTESAVEEEPSQPLLISNTLEPPEQQQPIEESSKMEIDESETEDGNDDSQVVAQIVKADPPSPGGTRKVVLMLPDGNLMMTDVTAEQYAALELDK